MNFDKYTDRSRGFVQAAQSLAQREGHQQFAPEHLLKVLLDDPEGLAAGLIDRSGGNSRAALAATEAALTKRPKISGGGAGQNGSFSFIAFSAFFFMMAAPAGVSRGLV